MPRTVRNAKAAIRRVLAEHGSLKWLEIKETTKLSKAALSVHLNDLIERKVVEARVGKEPRKHTATVYRLATLDGVEPAVLRQLEDLKKLATSATSLATQSGLAICRMEDRGLARDALREYLDANMRWIAGLVVGYMALSAASSRGFEERVESGVRAVALRERKRDAYMANFEKQLREHIDPWIAELANAVFSNGSIAFGQDGAAGDVAAKFIREVKLSSLKEWTRVD
jgi:hypothetical protein